MVNFNSIENLYDYLQKNFWNFVYDSRFIQENSVFFAIKGQNTDGHNFLKEIFQKDKTIAIIDQKNKFIENKRCILVENVLETLKNLASFKISKIKKNILAITGSSGKTTTKELLFEILSKKYKVFLTEGNQNTKITVPIKILNTALENYDLFIFEIGASCKGEIKYLCEITNPSFGIITKIGSMHLSSFGSEKNIFETKTELFSFLKEKNGTAFINSKFDSLLNFAEEISLKKVIYQKNDDQDKIEIICHDPFLSFSFKEKVYKTNLLGKYQIDNISAALAIGKFFSLEENSILETISTYIPKNKRSEKIITQKKNFLIMDCYNANLEGIIDGLEALDKIEGNKIAILGSMKETGDKTKEFHEKVGLFLQKINLNQVLLLGEEYIYAKNIYKNSKHFIEKKDLENYIIEKDYSDSFFFIKGAKIWSLWDIEKFL
jgi:UDP-N-acetylmuramoyl-tripeptide--D-alanyl-D-alanine ligase